MNTTAAIIITAVSVALAVFATYLVISGNRMAKEARAASDAIVEMTIENIERKGGAKAAAVAREYVAMVTLN